MALIWHPADHLRSPRSSSGPPRWLAARARAVAVKEFGDAKAVPEVAVGLRIESLTGSGFQGWRLASRAAYLPSVPISQPGARCLDLCFGLEAAGVVQRKPVRVPRYWAEIIITGQIASRAYVVGRCFTPCPSTLAFRVQPDGLASDCDEPLVPVDGNQAALVAGSILFFAVRREGWRGNFLVKLVRTPISPLFDPSKRRDPRRYWTS